MAWTWAAHWRDERGGWWRFGLTLLLAALGFALSAVVVRFAQEGLRESVAPFGLGAKLLVQFCVLGAAFGLMLVGLLVGVRFVHGKPVKFAFTDGRAFNPARAVQSAGVFTLLWLIGELALNGPAKVLHGIQTLAPLWWLALAPVAVLGVGVQSAAEEVLFRGYLQPRLGAWIGRAWVSVPLVAAVFSVLHLDAFTAPAMTAILCAGLTFGLAAYKTGSLAALIGMHTANNTLSMLLFPTESNMGLGWTQVLVLVLQLLLWLGWVLSTEGTRRGQARAGLSAQPTHG